MCKKFYLFLFALISFFISHQSYAIILFEDKENDSRFELSGNLHLHDINTAQNKQNYEQKDHLENFYLLQRMNLNGLLNFDYYIAIDKNNKYVFNFSIDQDAGISSLVAFENIKYGKFTLSNYRFIQSELFTNSGNITRGYGGYRDDRVDLTIYHQNEFFPILNEYNYVLAILAISQQLAMLV